MAAIDHAARGERVDNRSSLQEDWRVESFVQYLEAEAERRGSHGRKEDASRSADEEEGPVQMASLVPVQVVADPSASDAPVEVHLPGAVMLRISSAVKSRRFA